MSKIIEKLREIDEALAEIGRHVDRCRQDVRTLRIEAGERSEGEPEDPPGPDPPPGGGG